MTIPAATSETTPSSRASRALHHLRPPVNLASALDRSEADKLRAIRQMLVDSGYGADYRVDRERVHPAQGQIERHILKGLAVTLLRALRPDPAQVALILPGWEAHL